MDTDLVPLLKKALASEYQAFHMYRSAYYRIRGSLRPIVMGELLKHSEEELSHANKLEDRINILGGISFGDYTEWDLWTHGNYDGISTNEAGDILSTIRTSEERAIALYRDIYDKCQSDPVTQDIVKEILEKEEEHLFDVKYNMIGYMV